MYSFLMLDDGHNESRHKSRALWNHLTCINDAEPWQGGTVQTIPSELSLLKQAFPPSLWSCIGGRCRLSAALASPGKNSASHISTKLNF